MTGSAEIGQGSDTALAMIAAEALGVSLDCMRVSSGSTDYGVDLGAYSSRQTLMSGHAAKSAGENTKSKVLAVLGDLLKVPVEQMDIKDNRIVFKGETPDFSGLRTRYIKEHRGFGDNPAEDDELTFKEAARIAFLEKGSIVGTGKYRPVGLGGKFKGAAVGDLSRLRPQRPGG